MRNQFRAALCCLGLSVLAAPLYAQDADSALCLDCHEPAQDWEGMSVDEILANAKDPEVSRHADNLGLSDEQLRQMVEALLAR